MKLSIFVFFVLLIVASSFDFDTLQFHVDNLEYFIDFPSFLIILIPTILFAVGSYSRETYVKTWSISFGNPENCDQSELIEVNKCLNTMGNMSIVMGILGTLIGLILILQNFHNIGENLGPSLAVAIITLYYGFIFKALFMSASSKVEKYIK